MSYSEMVGRDNELNRLGLQVVKLIEGEGSIVNIFGEAGIGKSRLVAELMKYDLMNRFTLLEGRAISLGRNLSFHPIIHLLRQWARIREDDGEATALGKLEMAVKRVDPDEAAEVFPFVATLMGMKLPSTYAERVNGIEGEPLEKLILKNMRELLKKVTELKPLVLIIEDLHWADTSSIQLLESLHRLVETHSILFVNIFRPGHSETADRLAETAIKRFSSKCVEIVLQPLNERMTETLVANMLKITGPHQAIIRQIVQRAGGNPFFIEEVVRSLIDERAVVVRDGKFQVTEKIDTVSIPNTINDVLMARIDRLDEKTRELVMIASIIGRNFFLKVLSAVATDVEDIEGKLDHLKQIQLIRERKRMDEIEYLFNHALAQEAVYESILPLKRKEQHLHVAQGIENVFAHRLQEFYGMLAYHFSRAKYVEKAEEYLIKAGEEALRSSASNEALHYYQEALDLYLKQYGNSADPEKIAMLKKNIALALFNRGQYDEAAEYFDKALYYYWGAAPRYRLSAAFKFLSSFFHLFICIYFPSLKFTKLLTPRDDQAIDLFFKKLKALAIINPTKFFIESFHFYKTISNFDLSKFELGFGLFAPASTLFSFSGISFRLSTKILDLVSDRIDKDNIKAYTIYDFSETIHNYLEGNWKTLKAYDEDLVNKNLSIGEVYLSSQHLYWHGYPLIYQGSLKTAEMMVDKLRSIAEIYDNDFSRLLKYKLDTDLLIERRKLHEAITAVEEAIVFAQKGSYDVSLIDMYSCKAWIHILLGNIEQAKKALQHAKNVKTTVRAAPIQLSNFCRSQLEYDLYRLKESMESGNKEMSSEYKKRTFKSCKSFLRISRKAAQHRIESYKLMGLYYSIIKRPKRALTWWLSAIREGERLGARLELSRTYFAVGQYLQRWGSKYPVLDGKQPQEYLERAKALFHEMDLHHDLAEVDSSADR
jgi:tetratricopeptide (TPR) repeat protein